MAIGLSGGLIIGTQGLAAQNQALDTVGNNLANANTPGYARQRANIVEGLTVNDGIGPQGLGSQVTNVQSLRDNLLDGLVQESLGNSGFHDNQSSLYSTVQTSLGEQFSSSTASSSGTTQNAQSTTGVQTALTNFFSSFQNLASTPTDSTARQLVVQKSQALASTINAAYGRVRKAESDISDNATAVATQINTLSKQIGSLNQQIKQVKDETGFVANSLTDTRTATIEQLSQLVNVTTATQSDGSINIALQDNSAVSLVTGSFGGGNGGGTQSLSVNFNADASVPITVTASSTGTLGTGLPSGGSLGANLDTINNLIGAIGDQGGTGVLGQMDAMATSLISQVNTQHKAGQDSNGNTGGAFFTGTGAANLAVSSSIVANPALIAASNGSGVLDGSNATALSDLENSSSILPAFQTTVSKLGASVSSAANAMTTQDQVTQNLQQQRDSVSGVSIDQEMTDLIKFQQAYESSARFINTISGLFSTLLNIVHN